MPDGVTSFTSTGDQINLQAKKGIGNSSGPAAWTDDPKSWDGSDFIPDITSPCLLLFREPTVMFRVPHSGR